MTIVIVGGGKIGYFTAKSLTEKGGGRRGNKFISLFWEIPSSLFPHPSYLNPHTSLVEDEEHTRKAGAVLVEGQHKVN